MARSLSIWDCAKRSFDRNLNAVWLADLFGVIQKTHKFVAESRVQLLINLQHEWSQNCQNYVPTMSERVHIYLFTVIAIFWWCEHIKST